MQRRTRLGVWRAAIAGAIVGALALTAGPAIAARHGDDRGDEIGSEFVRGRAKNVILFIGDGMGDSEITIARNYAKGAAGRPGDGPAASPVSTRRTRCRTGTADVPDYVTDSAASGTGWATGHKTYNNAVSVDPVTKKPLETVLERAQEAGCKTGNITTAELTDATPAVLELARQAARVPGPGRHGDVPDRDEAGRRARVDRRADRRPQGRRADGRGQGPVRPGHRRHGPTVLAAGAGRGLPGRDRPGRPGRGEREQAVPRPVRCRATWTSSGPARSPRRTRAPRRRRAPRPNPARPATEPHLSDMTTKAIDLLDREDERRPQRLLPPGRGRVDRQAGPRGEPVRSDR